MAQRSPRNRPARTPSLRLALEPRIVFDGAAPVAAIHAAESAGHEASGGAPPQANPEHAQTEHFAIQRPPANQDGPTPIRPEPIGGRSEKDHITPVADPVAATSTPHEIAFVDASVQDVEAYLPGFEGEIVTIRSGSDGFDQIAAALKGRTDVTAVHIVSHGGDGFVSLGSGTLQADNLSTRYAEDLATIGAAMTTHGDILIYGCDVAKGTIGQAFIEQLAAATGKDVAASTNDTGAASRGGDWVLEAQTGTIEAQALDASGYDQLLVAPTVYLGPNLINDGNFDNTIQPGLNAVNSVGLAYNGFTSSTTIGIIRVNGSIYANGPDTADTGTQYLQLQTGTAGNVRQTFTLTSAQTIQFGAVFGKNGLLATTTGTVSILNSGNVSQGSATVSINPLTSTLGDGWAQAASSATLAAGTYTVVLSATGSSIDVDSVFVKTAAFATSYVENAAPTAIAAPTANLSDIDSPLMAGATVTLTNAQFGDVLTQIGAISSSITVGQYDQSAHTLVLSGLDTRANYLAAIQAIGFSNVTESPSTVARSISVTVNDGLSNSNAATTTVVVSSINDAPALYLNGNTNLLVDGDFENTVQANTNGNNVGGTTYGAYTATVPINVVRVDGTGYAPAPDRAYSGSQYVDLNGSGSIQQSFTLATAQSIEFGGAFSNRDNNLSTYAAPTTTIQILNSSGTVVATSGALSLTRASGNENWYLSSGSAALAAGNYTYRVTMGDFAQADALYVRNSVNYTTAVAPNGTQVAVAPNAAISDLDGTTITSGFVALTEEDQYGTLSIVGTLPTGITASPLVFNGVTVEIDFFGPASLAAYAAAYRQIVYSTTSSMLSQTTVYAYVSDGAGFANTATTTININAAPVTVAPASVATTEDTSIAFSGARLLTVSDTDTSNLTVTLAVTKGTLTMSTLTGLSFTVGSGSNNTAMTFSGTQAQLNAALASLTYVPTADYNGSDALTFATTDGFTPVTKTVALTLAPVADIVADSLTTNQNTAITFNAITGTNGASADNFENAGRAVTSVTQGAHGSVAFAADGTLTYTPVNGYAGGDTFTYTVTSGGVTETATETVTVRAAPTSVAPASIATTEDTTIAFTLGNALSVADADSASLSVTLSVTKGTLTMSTLTGLTFTTGDGTTDPTMTFSGTKAQLNTALATLTYVPTADYNGADALTFTTSDGNNAPVVKTVALTLTPVADIVADSLTTNQNTAITFNAITGTNGASADNFENAGRAVTSVTQGAHGSVAFAADGTLTYTPVNGYAGGDTFTYTVTSGGVTETATETITVLAPALPPTSTAPTSITAFEDTPVFFLLGNALTVGDPDTSNLTVTLTSTNGTMSLTTLTGLTFTTGDGTADPTMTFSGSQLQINLALATLSYTPVADYNGPASIQFTTSDGTASVAKTIGLAFLPVADITADNVATLEDTPITFNAILGTNGAFPDNFENPGRVLTSVTQGANGTVTFAANGTLTYTPNANYNGIDTFTYTVTSGGVTETATETVTVVSVNDAPTQSGPATITSPEDATIVFTGLNALSVADVDSNVLTVTLDVGPGRLTLGTTTGLVFTYGNGTADGAMQFTGTKAQVNAALATLVYVPRADYYGPELLHFVVDDGLTFAERFIPVTITPVADIVADTLTINEDSSITFNAITGTNGASADNFENPDRTVTFVAVGGTHGSFGFLGDGTMTYTPFQDYNGTDVFTYTVTSGGVTESATITINVLPVNDAPTSIAPTTVVTVEDTNVPFNGGNFLFVSDVDSPNLTVTLIATNGTTTLASRTGLTFSVGNGLGNATMTFSGTQSDVQNALSSASFAPVADFNGSGSLQFIVGDGQLSTTKNIALTFLPVADIVADNVTTNEDTPITFNAITGTNGASADNFENPGRFVSAVTQGAHGSVAFTADGTLTYTPTADFNGTDTFTYTVTSGGVTETATETITIVAVNDAPVVLAPASVTVAEDTTIAFTGLNTLSTLDVDSAFLTVSLSTSNGTLSVGNTFGVLFTTGHGSGDTAMVFSGTQAAVNAVLATLTFVPTPDFNGTTTLGFASSDGTLSTNRTIVLNLTPVADIVADTVTTAEDTPVTFNAITGTNGASADNFENPGRFVSAVTQGAHGSVSFAADGTLTYSPASNYNGVDSFTYTVTSGGVTETATVTVNITPVNDAPTSAAPASITFAEDTTIGFVGANQLSVADVDNASLTVTLSTSNGTLTLGSIAGLTFTTGHGSADTTMTFSGATAQLNAALASLTFAPTADYNGSASLAFSVSDGALTTNRTVALTVTPVADIVADTVTTSEDTPITFNVITGTNGASADNFENAGRVVGSVTQGAHGTVAFAADGTITYSPVQDYNGTDSFTYTVTSGGVAETATVTVNVTPVNDAPTSAAPTAITVAEDTSIAFTGGNALAVADVDSPALTVTLGVNNGTLTLGTITGLTFTTGHGTADPTMTFSGTQAQLNAALATLSFAPTADYNGNALLTFATSDGSLGVSKTVTLTMTAVADIVADTVTTLEDTPITFNAITGTSGASADNFENPGRFVSAVTQGAHGSVSFAADGTMTYAPASNYNGVDSFTYTVTSGGVTETATVTVNITAVDDAPTSTAPVSLTTAEDTTLSFAGANALTVGDVDNPSLAVTLSVTHGSLTLGTTTGLAFTTGHGAAETTMTFSGTQAQLNAALASLTFAPAADYNGNATLTFVTSDGSLTTSKSVAVTIGPVADIVADAVTTNRDTAITFNVLTGTNGASADNFEDAGRVVSAVTQGAHGSVAFQADGTLTYTPASNYSGADSFTYTVTAGGVTETATVTMTINAVNHPPVAVADSFTTAEDEAATIKVLSNDSDADNDVLTITQVDGHAIAAGGAGVAVTGGVVTLDASGRLTFAPTADYHGSPTFTYTIADPSGATATATVSGTVTSVNDSPVAVDDAGATNEDSGTSGNALSNDSDVDGDPLVVATVGGSSANLNTSIAGNNGGLFTVHGDGSYTFATNGAFDSLGTGQTRTSSVDYGISDGHGGTASATITVTVTGVNDAPTVVADSFDTLDTSGGSTGRPLMGNVLANDSDVERDTLSVTAVDGSGAAVGQAIAGSYGSLTLNADGTFAYDVDRGNASILALVRGQTLVETFGYQASDGHGGFATTSLTIRINGTNDSPNAGNDGNDIVQGQATASGNVIAGVRTDGSGSTTTVPGAIDTDPNGDPLSISAIRLPADTVDTPVTAGTAGTIAGKYGTLVIHADGSYVYALDNDSPATKALLPGQQVNETFVYTVTDGSQPVDATITINLVGINDAPVAAVDHFTTAEDTPVVIDVRANDADPDHDPFVVTQVDGHAIAIGGPGVAVTGGVVVLDASGALVFTPTLNYNGSPSFTYTIADPLGATGTGTVTGTVTAVNDAPVAAADTFSGVQGSPVTIDVRTNDTDVDGDALTVVQVNGVSIASGGPGVAVNGGIVTMDGSGRLVFTPDALFSGTTGFSYVVSDPSGATARGTVTGNIAFVDSAPVAGDDSFTIAEDTSATIDVLNNDSDADGDHLTITQVDGQAITAGGAGVAVTGGVVTLDASSHLVFTPTADFNGSPSFTYTVSDPYGMTASATVHGTVTAVNDAPVATAFAFTSAEDTVATIDAVAQASDVDGDTLTIIAVDGQAITAGGGSIAVTGGSVALDLSGRLVFTPTANFNGPTSFSYTVSDPSGLASTATITGTITPVDDAPVATGTPFTTAEDTVATIDVLANASDVDGDPLHVSQVDGQAIAIGGPGVAVTGGVVTLDPSGRLVFTPTANFNGTTSFGYTIVDPSGAGVTATATGTITAVNDAPVATGVAFTAAEDTVATIDVLSHASDVDGDPLTVTQVDGQAILAGGAAIAVTGGSVALDATGRLVFTPTANFNGPTSFSYTVSDPSGLASTATITGTITPVDDAPVATGTPFTTAEDTVATIDVLANASDVDGDPLHVSQVDGQAIAIGGPGVAVTGGVVTLDPSGRLVFTPTANFNGTTSFGYTIVDPSGAGVTATATGTITAVNDAPVATGVAFTAAEDTVATIDVLSHASDVDGDPLTVGTIDGQAIAIGGPGVAVTGGVVTLDSAGRLVFTPTADFNGSLSFTYSVSDPSGAASTATVSGTITAVNDAPVAAGDSFTVAEDTVATIAVLANDSDADGDPLTVTQVNGHAITANGAAVAVTGGSVVLDGSGRLVFTPTTNFNGGTSFTYTIADPSGTTSTATVTGTVAPVNDTPVAGNDSFSITEDTVATIAVLANDSDADGDALTVTQVDGHAITAGGAAVAVTGGSVTLDTSGRLVFAPTADFNGSTSFTYIVADPSGATATATVAGTVTPVNDVPVAANDGFTVAEGHAIVVDVLANDSDADGDPLTITLIDGNAITANGPGVAVVGGMVTLDATGHVVFTPTAQFNGNTSFTYTVADPSGATATATVAGTVTPVNDAPVATADSFTVAEDTSAVIDVLANDSDADGDPLSVTQIDGHAISIGGAGVVVTGGVVTLDPSGRLVFTPAADFHGGTSFSYTASDPSGATSTATVSGTITSVNDVPVVANASFTVAEDTPLAIDALANASDADGDPLHVSQVDGQALSIGGPGVAVTGGVVTLDATGRLVFTPTADYHGATSFTYTVSDPSGASATATLAGIVTPVNDAPVVANGSFNATEDTPVVIDALANASDVDGDPLRVSQVDGQAVSIGGPGVAVTGGVVTLDATGRLVFTPTADYHGPTSFSYTVSDPSGASATATLAGQVVPVNDAPVVAPVTFVANEDTVAVIDVVAGASDVDGDPLSVTQVDGHPIAIGGPGVAVHGGVVTLDPSGRLVFTPTADFNGATTFSATVADPSGASGTATVSGSITPVNDPPTLANGSFTVAEDTVLVIDALAQARDVDGDALTVTQVDGHAIAVGGPGVAVTGGVVTLDASGHLVFTPTANYHGPTSFGYTVADPSGASASATLAGQVTPVDDAPIVANGSFTVAEDTVLVIDALADASDVDGDPLTVTQVDGHAISIGGPGVVVRGGVVTLDGSGRLVFTPTANFNGPTSFAYTVSDPSGASATATLAGAVTPVNDAPVAGAVSFTVDEDTVATIDVVAASSDVDGDPLAVTQVDGHAIVAGGAGIAVQGGTVALDATGRLVFTPTPDFNGTTSFSYTIADPSGAAVTATASGRIVAVNDAPVVTPVSFTANEDTVATIDVVGASSDVDGDLLSVTQVDGHAISIGAQAVAVQGGTVVLDASGRLIFAPTPDFNGATSFRYTIADPSGASVTATASGFIVPVNDAPVIVPSTFFANENTVTAFDALSRASDVDGDALTVTQVDGHPIAAGGAGVAVTGGVFTLDPSGRLLFSAAPGYLGPLVFSYTVADPAGATATSNVSGAVIAPNHAPVVTAVPFSIDEDTVAVIDAVAAATDVDGDPLAVTQVDGRPIAIGGPGVAVTGGIVTLDLAGRLVFTPAANYNGTTSFSYTVSDPSGAGTTVTTSGTIAAVNDAPVVPNASFSVAEDTVAVIDAVAGATDTDGDPLRVTQVDGQAIAIGGPGIVVSGGVVTLDASGRLVFTPTANYNGVTSFRYTVSDPSGAGGTATLSGSVAPVDDAPVITAVPFTVVENGVTTIDVLAGASDVDGDVLAVTAVDGRPIAIGGPGIAVAGGVVTLDASGRLVFTATPNYVGAAAFSYTISDPSGAATTVSTSGTVAIGDGVLIAGVDSIMLSSDAPLAIDVLANDVDPDGSPMHVTAIDGQSITAGGAGVAVTGGVVTIDAAGLLHFTPRPGASAAVLGFTYTVMDTLGRTATSSVAMLDNRIALPFLTAATNAAPAFGNDAGSIAPASVLHVLSSIETVSSEQTGAGGISVADFDPSIAGELADLPDGDTLDTVSGTPGPRLIGRDTNLFREGLDQSGDQLYVQNAVRSQSLANERGLFVQNAVRQSQVESRLRDLRGITDNSAATGSTTLFDPFAIGAPASAGGPDATSPTTDPAATPSPTAQADDVGTQDKPSTTANGDDWIRVDTLAPPPRPVGPAPGFTAQLHYRANALPARGPRSDRTTTSKTDTSRPSPALPHTVPTNATRSAG